jgi:hypothetical protein
VSLAGLSTAMAPSLSFAVIASLTFVRFKHEVTVDDDAYRKPRPDRQCWLDVEVALNGSLARLIHAVTGPATKCGDHIGIIASTSGRSKLAANPEQRTAVRP